LTEIKWSFETLFLPSGMDFPSEMGPGAAGERCGFPSAPTGSIDSLLHYR
jgi:hypothetical protein